MARESFISPDLPQVDFLDGPIVNEDKSPAPALDLVDRNSVDLRDSINSSEASNFDTQNASVTEKCHPCQQRCMMILSNTLLCFQNIEDQNSIIKILHAANSCVQRCPSVNKTEWAVPAILFSLKREENLLARDRVCVFLSLMLHNFSVVSSMNIGNILDDNSSSCLDSFSKHISSGMPILFIN
ncbi:maternal effect embryo arrest 22 [Raphanus sativus]|nr:maternal effect embryo arrest 22 [Raphanus sativus]